VKPNHGTLWKPSDIMKTATHDAINRTRKLLWVASVALHKLYWHCSQNRTFSLRKFFICMWHVLTPLRLPIEQVRNVTFPLPSETNIHVHYLLLRDQNVGTNPNKYPLLYVWSKNLLIQITNGLVSWKSFLNPYHNEKWNSLGRGWKYCTLPVSHNDRDTH
jgi:hypothetical protein